MRGELGSLRAVFGLLIRKKMGIGFDKFKFAKEGCPMCLNAAQKR